MNGAKYGRSEFIRLKTLLILSDLKRVGKAEIDGYAFSDMLAVILRRQKHE